MNYYDDVLRYKFGSIKLRQQRFQELNSLIPEKKLMHDEEDLPDEESLHDEDLPDEEGLPGEEGLPTVNSMVLYSFYLTYCYIILKQIIDILNIESDDISNKINKLYEIKYACEAVNYDIVKTAILENIIEHIIKDINNDNMVYKIDTIYNYLTVLLSKINTVNKVSYNTYL